MKLAAAALIVALAAGAALPGVAQPVVPSGSDLEAVGWRPILFRGRKPTRFESAGGATISVDAEASSSMLSTPLGFDPSAFRCVAWRWIVDESTLPATDLSRRGGDDRHLIVSIGFAFEPDRASLSERMRYALARQQAGRDIPARVLFYVWGGAHPRDSWLASPYMDGAGFIRVVEPAPGPHGRWIDVAVDVAADYEARFAAPPPPVVEIAIGSDSDDTNARTRGRIGDLAIKPRC
ncbi:MAG: DUF3047 domain-containing protein [Alphaproteobacteria bacterium]|nr:DUF3047 domain-containing protein [Alphaproteobacteria bacterium]